jgi:hypothetical protein
MTLFAQQFSPQWQLFLRPLIVPIAVFVSLANARVVAQSNPSTGTLRGQIVGGTVAESSVEFDRSERTEQGESQEKQKKKESRAAIVLAPIPISSPAIGTGAVIAGALIFPFQKFDTVSPPSVIGGAVLLTDNGSRAFGLGADIYVKQNTYHVSALYVRGNLDYDFFGLGTAAGDASRKLPLKQTGSAFLGDVLYRVGGRFFVGPRVLAGDSTITLRQSGETTIPPPPGTGINTSLSALGFRMNRDTRANRFYPANGTLFDFTASFFVQGLGSKYSFESYRSTFNYYRSFGSKQVLAYNLFICGTAGNPPFYGECIFGTNNQLRGYVAGQYIDRDMIATQAEYRLELPWRFGIAIFGGIGEVAPSVSQFRYDNLLPSGGGGVRFKLSGKYNVNLRADIAQGKNGHTFSMGIGEAF